MDNYNPELHHRRSIRLKNYDYTKEGLYFITASCQNRACLFGKIGAGSEVVTLNAAGNMIEFEWLQLPSRFPNIRLHEHIVMPNHFHGIVEIVGATLVVAQNTNEVMKDNDNRDHGQPQGIAPTIAPTVTPTNTPATPSRLGDMIGAFKSITTVNYIQGVKQMNWKPFKGKLWQRDYYEHIIRNEQAYENISNYIINNPKKWVEDRFRT